MIKCGHCRQRHASVTEVRECAPRAPRPRHAENPFIGQHLAYEAEATDAEYTHGMARALVMGEYAGRHHAIECGKCHETSAFYKATVGAWICTNPACGAMRHAKSYPNMAAWQADVAAGVPGVIWN